MATKLSDKQQQAMRYLEHSRAAGVSFSEHVRAQGAELRPMYDALAALRRKGALPSAAANRGRSAPAFVAVRVAPAVPEARPGMRCRVLIGAVAVIECCEWPPAAWLSSVLGTDAAA